ncbi:LysM peptidoglycan-binding domain-containing protein [Acinetobacter sp. c3-l95]|uniref:LysM peptidoglycan-binding domain-containing protein n=1 Tax=Acinetobacter sp. c3-l95 TaxID=3342804 RepID=UPI0035B854F4
MRSNNSFAPNSNTAKTLRFTFLTASLASMGLLVGCSSTPNTANKAQTKRVPVAQTTTANTDVDTDAELLDADSFDGLESLLYATDMRAVENDRLQILRHGDVWKRMTVGFKMDLDNTNSRISAQRSWFISRQPYIDRLSARASRYLFYTVREAERRGIPTELALLPVIESSYDPAATSGAAAAGLWQFIPSTGRIYGLRQSDMYDGRRDVVESTRAAYEFLTSLYNQFGSWELALAAYNAGPGRIQQAINRNAAAGLPTDYWSLRLPTETMNYVPRFLAVAQIVKNPNMFGVTLPPIANRQHFREVTVPGAIDLDELAGLTGLERSELYALNPAHRGNYTDPLAPPRVLIPNDVALSVDKKIAKMRTVSGTGGMWTGQASLPAYTPTVVQNNLPPVTQAVTSTITTSSPTAVVTTSSPVATVTTATTTSVAKPTVPVTTTTAVVPPVTTTLPTVPSTVTTSVATVTTPAVNTPPVSVVNPSRPVVANNATVIEDPLAIKVRPVDISTIQTQNMMDDLLEGGEKQITYAYPKAVAESIVKEESATARQASAPTTAQNKKAVAESKNDVFVAVPQGKRDVYTVQAGDTLSILATRFGVNMQDLARWNQISINGNLMAGTRLYVYNAKSPVNPAPIRGDRYVVKAGDTLSSIAQQANISMAKLAEWNDISNGRVQRGQTLTLVEPKRPAAPATNNAPATRTPTDSYTVKRGETLQAIANRFSMSTAELAALTPSINANTRLNAGQRINVPKQLVTANARETKTKTTLTGYERLTDYKVQSGETLQSLARKFDLSVQTLASLNKISTTARLQRGQSLKVPVVAIPSNRANASTTTPPTATTRNNRAEADARASDTSTSTASRYRGATESYTVKAGESLNSLSSRYKISVSQLADLNNLKANTGLRVGQTIRVPKLTQSYTVKSGDNMIRVARQFGISVAQLAEMNGLKPDSNLQRGRTITVPSK